MNRNLLQFLMATSLMVTTFMPVTQPISESFILNVYESVEGKTDDQLFKFSSTEKASQNLISKTIESEAESQADEIQVDSTLETENSETPSSDDLKKIDEPDDIEDKYTAESTYSDASKEETKVQDFTDTGVKDTNLKTSGMWGTSSWEFDGESGTLIFYSGTLGTWATSPWNTRAVMPGEIKIIELKDSIVAPTNSANLFNLLVDANVNSLLEIRGLDKLDTSNVTTMVGMFTLNVHLLNLDVSNFDTSNVTNMNQLFMGCWGLMNIDISNFDTSKASTNQMFEACRSLRSLSLGAKTILSTSTNLRGGFWSGENTKVEYATSEEFLNKYDGSRPDTFNRYDGKWGTSLWEFDAATGELLLYSGTLGNHANSPWNSRAIASGEIKAIELRENIIAPQNSERLFSSMQTSLALDNLTEIKGLNKLDTSQVTTMRMMFLGGGSLKKLDLGSFDTSKTTDMTGMFNLCSNLSSITLGSKFNPIGKGTITLPSNRWIGIKNSVRFETSTEFMTQYNGSHPDTYVWDNTAQLDLNYNDQNSLVIGKEEILSWNIFYKRISEKGHIAQNIKGELSTSEDIDPSAELVLEIQDSLGVTIKTIKVPLTCLSETNGNRAFIYELPNLTYEENYKVSLSVKAWNNTTISTEPTFVHKLNYEAILESEDGNLTISDELTRTTNQLIKNGTLSFKDIPTSLTFNTEKLNHNLNGKLISREKSNWQIGVSDFRGTKAHSEIDSTVSRINWELFATAGPFIDGKNEIINALQIAYIDDKNIVHELSEANETLLLAHDVSGEIPKINNYISIDWTENQGLQAIVHNRNALKSEETYKAVVTFELRSAP